MGDMSTPVHKNRVSACASSWSIEDTNRVGCNVRGVAGEAEITGTEDDKGAAGADAKDASTDNDDGGMSSGGSPGTGSNDLDGEWASLLVSGFGISNGKLAGDTGRIVSRDISLGTEFDRDGASRQRGELRADRRSADGGRESTAVKSPDGDEDSSRTKSGLSVLL